MIETVEAYGFSFAIPVRDEAVGRCLRTYGEFGRVGASLCGQIARGATFVDVGANVGAYALPVSRRAARVVAIEAQPAIAKLLARNVSENGATNIEVIAAAAGGETGAVQLPAADLDETLNFGAVGLTNWRGPTVQGAMVRLDDVAPADTRMVKIDVEGYEGHVLNGAPRLIGSVRPCWMIELGADRALADRMIRGMQAAGYRTYWFYDPFVTPQAPRGDIAGDIRRGDLSLFAASRDQGQPAGMAEIGETYAWDDALRGLDYLRAFGLQPFEPAPRTPAREEPGVDGPAAPPHHGREP